MRRIYLRKEKGQYTRESGDSNRLMVGNSDNGGASNVNWDHPGNSNDNIGFRAAVVLSSPKRKRPALSRAGLILGGRGFNPTSKHFAYFLERGFKS